jgi:hypothetical protein
VQTKHLQQQPKKKPQKSIAISAELNKKEEKEND